jgi:hypothetical protein
MSIFQDRIERLQSFEQILSQEKNYTVETYGRWHVPLVWYKDGVRATYYSYKDGEFHFEPLMEIADKYRDALEYYNSTVYESLHMTRDPNNPMLINSYNNFPYTPIRLDYRRQQKMMNTRQRLHRVVAAAGGGGSSRNLGVGVDTGRDEEEGRAEKRREGHSSNGSGGDSFFYYSKREMTLNAIRVVSTSTSSSSPAATTIAPTITSSPPPATLESLLVSSENGDPSPPGSAAAYGTSTVDESSVSQEGFGGIRGRDSLSTNYTPTAIEGDMALRALDRILQERSSSPSSNPFFLSVHFLSPVRF